MKWIIISAILFVVVIKFPAILLIGGLVFAILYFMSRESSKSEEIEPEKEEIQRNPYEKELESRMKPGFEDDPGWKARSKRIKEYVGQQEKKNMQEIIDEQETEIRKLKSKLRQLGAL